MSNKTAKLIRIIYGITLSVLLVVTGVLLMISCINIYRIGDRPFTVDNISAAFKKIAIPVYITLGAVAVGAILTLVLPAEKVKLKAIKDEKITLDRLRGRLNGSECDSTVITRINKEKNLRLILKISAAILCVAIAVSCAVYAFNINNFGADYNASVISACILILPCTFVAMGLCIALIYVEKYSVKRELALIRSALASQKGSVTPEKAPKKSFKGVVAGVRIALAVAAIALIVAGIVNGGMADVLSKAINICTECIGLG